MKPGWNQVMDSGFDRSIYSERPPGGTWRARIEQSCWAKCPGIHLFLINLDSHERFWFFVPHSHELYPLFRDLPDGSTVEVTVHPAARGRLPRLLTAKPAG